MAGSTHSHGCMGSHLSLSDIQTRTYRGAITTSSTPIAEAECGELDRTTRLGLAEIPRCGIARKGLRHLVGEPHLCGILGPPEMNDFSPVMVKHDRGIQDSKRRGGDHEHVDRRGISQVVVQKAAPSRGERPGVPRQITSRPCPG